MEQVIFTYTSTQRLGFYPKSFNVPKGTEFIEIHIGESPKGDWIDIAIESPQGYVGWSGGSLSNIIIGESYASPGYAPGIVEGEWKLIFGVAKLHCGGEVKAKIICHPSNKRWVPGDLHMHSIHSDGIYSVPEIMTHAKEAGLEFIALTDHNTQTGNDELSYNKGLTCIPGIELTTYYGHCNLWNVDSPLNQVLIDQEELLDEVLEQCGKNTIFSMNHPFFKDPWQMAFNHPFTHIEIWNAFWSEGNATCVNWWHNQLCMGNKLIAVGGSDSHGKSEKKWFGKPTTRVEVDINNKDHILDGLRNGRVCVCKDSTSPYLELDIDDEQLIMTIHNHSLCVMKLLSNEGLIYANKTQDSCVTYTMNIEELESLTFIRGELWALDHSEPLCFTNPLWL